MTMQDISIDPSARDHPRLPISTSNSLSSRRTVDGVAHQVVTAIGSCDVAEVQEPTEKSTRGDKPIEAYRAYEGVYADKVGAPGNQ